VKIGVQLFLLKHLHELIVNDSFQNTCFNAININVCKQVTIFSSLHNTALIALG